MTKAKDELLADDLRRLTGLVEGQRRRNEKSSRPRGRISFPLDLADRILAALRRTPPSVEPDEGVERLCEKTLLDIERVLQATPERSTVGDDLAQQQDATLIEIHKISQAALKQLRDLPRAALQAIPPLLERVIERCAEACYAVESPFDEHAQAPENCAFYDATEACEQAIRQIEVKDIVGGGQ